MSVDAWGTMSRDVFGCIFRLLNLSSKRAMLRVCKRFYWLIKPHLVVTVVPNAGWYKGTCVCCAAYNKTDDSGAGDGPFVRRFPNINKQRVAHVPQMGRVECEYGHVFPSHAIDVTRYEWTPCPKDGCGHSILLAAQNKKKRKTK